jgi:hypothetical protein
MLACLPAAFQAGVLLPALITACSLSAVPASAAPCFVLLLLPALLMLLLLLLLLHLLVH